MRSVRTGGFRHLWARFSRPITDRWPRERRAVFESTHWREENGGTNAKIQILQPTTFKGARQPVERDAPY